jgi:hypothetical protein
MPMRHTIVLLALFGLFSAAPRSAESYTYCGFHDRRYQMRAIHFNSEFWVNMVVAEANKWNAVHPVLAIDRTRSSTVPLGRDGTSVISWIAEADLKRVYGLSWTGNVGWTVTWTDGTCGRFVESDMFFNPAITLFTPQTAVPFNLGFQEIALHELGHAVTLEHEDGSLSVMTTNNAISDMLHHNDKVGWIRSARQRFNPLPTDQNDMGIFPIRNVPGSKVYSTLLPATVRPGGTVTIKDFTVENLSSVFPFSNPRFRLVLENISTGASTEVGSFSWASFGPFSQWAGDLAFMLPPRTVPARYRVVGIFDGRDDDRSNDRAVFGILSVR